MNYRFIFDGALSKRYHTVDTLKEQNIAEHSFGVAWLCEVITAGNASKNLIMAALTHDLAEHLVGDIPSPVKRSLGLLSILSDHENNILEHYGFYYDSKLTSEEASILKLADYLEGMLHCVRERNLGNKGIQIVYLRFEQYCEEILNDRLKTSIHRKQAFDLFQDIAISYKEMEDGSK